MRIGQLWSVWAALSALAGTAVGHPTQTKVAAGNGLVYTSAELPVSQMVVEFCDETQEIVEVGGTLDPVANDTLMLPVGEICRIKIELSDRFKLYGTGPSSSSFELSLGVGQINITVDPPIVVEEDGDSDAQWIRLAVSNWVTATLLDLDPNEHVTVGAGHALHAQLSDAVKYDSDAW